MQLRNSTRHYGPIALTTHWLTVLLVAVAWLIGTFGDVLPRGAPRQTGLFVHMSAGLAILILALLRLAWRSFDPPPPLEPTRLGPWQEIAARHAHLGLYALLIAIPIMGVTLQFARGEALPVFGLAHIASPWARDRAFAGSVREVHEVLANILMIAVGLHAAVALAHHYVLRDRTLVRMLPGNGRRSCL